MNYFTENEKAKLIEMSNRHIPENYEKSTLNLLNSFLDGKLEKKNKISFSIFGRNISYYGNFTDHNRGSILKSEHKLYKRLYKIKITKNCKYCKKEYQYSIMTGDLNYGACSNTKCITRAIIESI